MHKRVFLLLSAALLTQAATAQTTTMPLDSLRARASHTLHAKRYAEAAALFQQQTQAERSQSAKASAFYNLACAQALGGQPQPALRALAQAERLGFHKVDLARTDTDLTTLRTTPEFAKIVGRMEQVEARLADPRQAKLVTQRHRLVLARLRLGCPRHSSCRSHLPARIF